MTPEQFIDKWTRADRTERQAAQEHFIDLCRVLGEPTPNEAADPEGYSFEKGVSKTDGTGGFADVWKRGHFGWEYKKDRANLDRAYQQLQLYSVALEHPPLLVVSDTKRFRIYTNWTNTVQAKHDFALDDLARSETRELLHNVFRNPDKLKPDKTREQVTKEAATDFSTIAERLRTAGHAPQKVAHFLNRLVFCLFAEDVNLLQDDLFKRMLESLSRRRDQVPERSQKMLAELFTNMRAGGNYGLEHILHFNGGLFDDDEALPLDADSLDILRNISKQDWSAIDPSIFGTLFERFLDPDKRAQIGAHYTDPGKIMMIVEPVIMRPLTAEWEAVKAELVDILSRGRTRDGMPGPAALSRAEARLDTFLKRLADVRILDPACGSGNFLYLALQSLKDLEYRAIVEAEAMGLARRVVHCGPHNVKGIEINPYAAELARTAIWIGNIQWLRRNGFEARKEPVLEDLDAIECRDALITRVDAPAQPKAPSPSPLAGEGSAERSEAQGEGAPVKKQTPHPARASRSPPSPARGEGAERYVEAEWPKAEFIIGNPPFLGGKLMRRGLSDEYVDRLFSTYRNLVSPEADFVTYWFYKARSQLQTGSSKRAGLVSTNSIRDNNSRRVLDHIIADYPLFEAWADEPWVVEGAAVRVSLLCFGRLFSQEVVRLDGMAVSKINSDLSSRSADLTQAKRLTENSRTSFQGVTKGGPFEVTYETVVPWLVAPLNPNGRPNSDVIRRIWSGGDIVQRREIGWVIDFFENDERSASLYEAPFQFACGVIKPKRLGNSRALYRENWWLFIRPRREMRIAIAGLTRYIATPKVSKHRVFVWMHKGDLPDNLVIAISKDDDVAFGILNSRFHITWSLDLGSTLEDRPTYTPTSSFETFPFPEGLTPNIPPQDYADDPRAIAIAKAAKRLDELRNAWLNPPDLIDIVPEVVPGYPDRILPKNEEAAAILKKRTLTNLYNARPQWLADAHRDLDVVVAAAYGWPADISEEDALAKLLELNLARAGVSPAPAAADDETEDDESEQSPSPALGRKAFEKISEVEGIRLTDEMKKTMTDFDRRKLSPEARRRAILGMFKHAGE